MLEQPIVHPKGDQVRQPVQHLKPHSRRVGVGQNQAPNQGRERHAWQGEVRHARGQATRGVLFLHHQVVHTYAHFAGDTFRWVGRKRFKLAACPFPFKANKGSETHLVRLAVSLVGRLELQDGLVLAVNTKTADTLAAVVVKHPHGNASQSSQPGQERRKRRLLLKITDSIPSVVVKKGQVLLKFHSYLVTAQIRTGKAG